MKLQKTTINFQTMRQPNKDSTTRSRSISGRNQNSSRSNNEEDTKKDSRRKFNTLTKEYSQLRLKAQILNSISKKVTQDLDRKPLSSLKYSNIFMFLLLLLTQFTFFFNEEMSELYYKTLSIDDQLKKTILSPNSSMNLLLHFFSIVETMRFFSPEFVLFLFSVLIIINVLVILLYLKTSTVRKFLLKFNSREGDIKLNGLFLAVMAFVFRHFDFVFLISNYMSISSFFCRVIQVPITSEDALGVQEASIKADYLELTGGGLSELTKPKSVHFLNDDIECLNTRGYALVLNIMGFVLIISNLGLKIIFNKIWSFTPSLAIKKSKFGNVDWLIDLCLVLGITIRAICSSFYSDEFAKIQTIILVYFAIVVLSCCIIWVKCNFYCEKILRLKKFQLTFMCAITGLHIAATHKPLGTVLFDREFSSWLVFLVIITLILRIGRNSKTNTNSFWLVRKITNGKIKKKLTAQQILCINYSIKKYIALLVESKRLNTKTSKETRGIALMINTLFEWHKSNCAFKSCLCQGKNFKKITRKNPIFVAMDNEIFNETNFALKGVIICEEIMRSYIEETQNPNLTVVYTYIEFLIDYLGKPVLAKMMIQKTKTNFLKNSSSLELEILKEKLDELMTLNLMNGSLALSCYHRLIHNEITRKNDTVDAQDHVLFLNSMERLKSQIKDCAQVKLRFLKDLRDNPRTKLIFRNVKDFSKRKKSIAILSEKLIQRSRGLYPPLVHIMWKFTRDVVQDYVSSNGYLSLYEKSVQSKFSNLNLIFYNNDNIEKIKLHEFSTIFISGEKENNQDIIYCTSNMFDLTGKSYKLIN